jgi:hypothetical protein
LQLVYTPGKTQSGKSALQNKSINRNYLEDVITNRVGEIIFDEKYIPALIQTYYGSIGELFSAGEKS